MKPDAEVLAERRPCRGRRPPDAARAHGAWVYLGLSVAAGTLTGARAGVGPALIAGVGFAGVFLAASGLALGAGRIRLRRILMGGALAFATPFLALALGANPIFLVYGLIALFPAALAGYAGGRLGYHSSPALGLGIAALAVAAPASACAGGATPLRAWVLLGLLTPFFAFRAARVRRALNQDHGWSRRRLHTQGWIEAGYAVGWTALSILIIHLL